MVVNSRKSSKTKNQFRIQKMSQDTGISVERIKEILSSKTEGGGRISAKDLRYNSLSEAKSAAENLEPTSEKYPEALGAWIHFALIKVDKACVKSIMIDLIEICPENTEAERRLVKKLAFSYGFNGKLPKED
ncbi:MAG: hypothetical protein VB048_05930 [Bacteroidaceae bacterium]|nr:hypothetical protein [Candidatus Elulimicrobiales bacterium]MEA4967639.1 hypothetical protein [Bacteroidaceae bacterium]